MNGDNLQNKEHDNTVYKKKQKNVLWSCFSRFMAPYWEELTPVNPKMGRTRTWRPSGAQMMEATYFSLVVTLYSV